jgi:uncharacterized membrane protein
VELRHGVHLHLEEGLMVAAVLPSAQPGVRRDLAGLILGAILVFALAIRFYNLDTASLWEDEIAAIEIARVPLSVLWSDWMVRETNPPLYYSLLHLWMKVFGDGAFAVRSLSAIAGGAAVWLVFLLGRAVGSTRVGLIAALLTAAWSHQVYFGQEARGYIFAFCGAVTAMIGLVGIADQVQAKADAPGGLKPWALYLAGCLAATYTHTTLVFLPLLSSLYFVWLWGFRSERRWRDLGAWTLANGLLLAGWAWWGYITYLQVSRPDNNINWIPRTSPVDAFNIVTIAYGPTGVSWENSLLRIALQIGGGGLVLLAAAWGALRLGLERAAMLAVFAIGLPVLVFLISLHTPMMMPRILLWGHVGVLIGLASALAAVKSPKAQLAIGGLVLAMLILGHRVQNPKEPWEAAVAELDRRVGPDDLVLASGAGILIQHYCDKIKCGFETVDVLGPSEAINHWKAGMFRGPRPTPDAVPALIAGHPRVWTVTLTIQDPRPFVAPHAVEEPVDVVSDPLERLVVSSWRPKAAAVTMD